MADQEIYPCPLARLRQAQQVAFASLPESLISKKQRTTQRDHPSGGAIALTSGKSTYGESGCITVRTADGGRSDDEYRTNSGSIHLATGTATGAGGSIIMEAGAGYGDGRLRRFAIPLTAGDNLNEVPEENYAGGNIHISAGADLRKPRVVSVALLSGGGKLATGGDRRPRKVRAKRTVRSDLYK